MPTRNQLAPPPKHSEEAQWISLSDLMTGLMMVFLLIAVAFMIKVEADAAKARQVAILYDEIRQNLYLDLDKEFHSDLSKWGAEINRDNLSIRFKEPEILFKRGEAQLNPKFQKILADFFPRYVSIINKPEYKDSIEEIRIEGHTSSVWNNLVNADDAYFNNMELSQSRTRSTLRYVLELPTVRNNMDWLKRNVTANGLSSSKPIINDDGIENENLSQRVEFKIRTNADAKLSTILGEKK